MNGLDPSISQFAPTIGLNTVGKEDVVRRTSLATTSFLHMFANCRIQFSGRFHAFTCLICAFQLLENASFG